MIAHQPNPPDPHALEKERLLRAFHETGVELSEALEELTEAMVEAHARKGCEQPPQLASVEEGPKQDTPTLPGEESPKPRPPSVEKN